MEPHPSSPSFTTDRPVAVLMIFLAAVVFGCFSLGQLPVTLMPEMSYPTLTVRTEYPGAAPEEVENDVSRRIEEQLGVVSGLNEISSISRAGVSDVVLEFIWGTSMVDAIQNTLEKLDTVYLPRGAEKPLLLHYDPSLDPVMELSLSEAASEEEVMRDFDGGNKNLEEIADTIVYRRDGREIRLKDLGQVVYGQRDREMLTRTDGGDSVQIDVYKEADSNMVQVGERIKTAVGSVSGSRRTTIAGKLYQEEDVILQVVADRSVFIDNSIREVKRTAVAGGFLAIVVLLIFLRDIRTTSIIAVSIPISILVTFAPLNLLGVSLNIMSLGGLAMGIGMLVDSSIVVLESIYRCREEGDSMRDAAIRGTREVRGAVIASTLTSICVFFPMVFVEGLAGQVFSDLDLTVVTSLLASLVVAVLFIPMLASRTGFKLKDGIGMASHVLGGFAGRIRPATFLLRVAAPCIGLLAVMIGAVIAHRYWGGATGENPNPDLKIADPAAMVGVLRFWGLIVLVPFVVALAKVRRNLPDGHGESLAALWGSFDAFGRAWRGGGRLILLKRFYVGLRLPLSFLLELIGLSLVWLIRSMAWMVFALLRLGRKARRLFERRSGGSDPEIERGVYPKALRWALANPVAIMALAAATIAATYLVGKQLQSELLPEVHQSEFTFEIALPVGTPLAETVATLKNVERAILDRKDDLDIDTLLVMYGFDASNMKRSDEGEHSARFKVLPRQTENPVATEEQVIAALRRMFERVPDVTTRVTRPVLFSSKKPVVVQINGEDLSELKQFSDRATLLLARSPELADVEPTLRSGAPEVQIAYDRHQIIRHGLNIDTVADQVRDMVKGSEATRLNRRDRRVPIVVRLSEADREQVADVGHLTINPGGETPVPLDSIARLTVGEGPSEIRRIDGKRVALVQANIGGGSLGAAVESARKTLEQGIEWPDYMDFMITGQNREWERSRASLFLALGLSLFWVYMLMAFFFESLLIPLSIIMTIPLASMGAVLALKVSNTHIDQMVYTGALLLVGIVVNNGIVLVDYANRLRRSGLDRSSALLTAARHRFRPIIMTALTTICGMIPLTFGSSDEMGLHFKSFGLVLIGGMTSATLFTLLAVPVFYTLIEDAREGFNNILAGVFDRSTGGEPRRAG